MYHERSGVANTGGVFKIYDEPLWPNVGAFLTCRMNRWGMSSIVAATRVRSASDKTKTETGAYGFGDRAYRGRDRGLWKMDRGLRRTWVSERYIGAYV